MPRAYSLIRSAPWYRAQSFVEGLRRAGYEVKQGQPERARPGDVLLIWNRYFHYHDAASKFEAEGGRVVVAENGYLGAGGTSPKFDVHPHGPQPGHYYALGLGFHNDSEGVLAGDGSRWSRLGVELKPWRTSGEHILVAPNRPFGVPGRSMPPHWAEDALRRLRKTTRRPVRVRAHPGNDAPRRPLEADLEGAWAVVIWSSTAGIHALAAGIPVFCEAPAWVLRGAAAGGTVDGPILPDRLPHFERLAWAQWTIEEISTGAPFRWLIG